MKLLAASKRALTVVRPGSAGPTGPRPSDAQVLAELAELERQAKEELLALQRKKEYLHKNRKLWFWKPSPKQLLFFVHAATKRRAGFCGNRFGKSELGVIEDICWMIGYRPFFPEGHALRYLGIPKHGVKGLLIAEDWDKVKEVFTNNESADRAGKFYQFLPEDFIKHAHKNEKGVIDIITVTSMVDGVERESVLYFDTVRSFKQNPASAESSDWDFIHVDEPISKDYWKAVSRGLIDRGGFSWWLLTPIKEPWMYSEQVANAALQPNLYWWFEATMDDNPTLSEEDKALYLDQLPEDEKEARRKGIPLAYGRLVFSDYKPEEHDLLAVPADWPNGRPPFKTHMVAYAIDTHPQTPHAGLFISVNVLGDIDIWDEIWYKGKISELADIVLSKLQGTRVAYGLCEPAAWNEDQGSGFCYADMFYAKGLDLVPGSKRKEDAILLTQELFKQRRRKLRIHKRCTQLRKELHAHYFDKDNKPVDKDDHVIECLRRLVIHDNLQYYPAVALGSPMQFTTERDLLVSSGNLDIGQLSLTNI